MTTTDSGAAVRAPRAAGPEPAWVRLLAWTSVATAAADLGAPALSGAIIPPLAAGAVLTVVGLLLLRRFPRSGVVLLGLTNLLLVTSSAPFAIPSLAHPDSPIGFVHATIHMVGRPIAVVVAVAALRHWAPSGARRVGVGAAALLAATVIFGTVSAALTSDNAAQAGDVRVEVRNAAFPETVRVASGGTLFVDNADQLRHTFSVEGTDISLQLPERSSARVDVDLTPGTYRMKCEVPGHESMTGALVVQ
jgi:plastocyanin